MDNLSVTLINTGLNTSITENIVSGELRNIPKILEGIKPGESLLLQILSTSTEKITSGNLNANLLIDNKEIPLQLKTEFPLKPETGVVLDVVAKVSSRPVENALPIKIISVNGQKAENFVRQTKVEAELKPNVGQSPVFIKENNSQASQIKFLPLKIAPFIEKIMQESFLPPSVRKQVLSVVKNIEFPVEIKTVLAPDGQTEHLFKIKDAPMLEDKILAVSEEKPQPSADGLKMPKISVNFSETIEKFFKPVQNLIKQISENQHNPQQLETLIKELPRQLLNLPDSEFTAIARVKENIVVLQTPLGEVLPEAPLKINPETEVVLRAGKAQMSTFQPQVEMLDGEDGDIVKKLLELLKPEEAEILKSPIRLEKKENLILQKLMEKMPENDFVRVMDKIPAVNTKLLSNLTGFIKASTSQKIEDWLGKNLTEEIKTRGSEGQETLSKLTQYVTSHVKEGVSWRMIDIPVLGEGITKIRVAVKKNKDNEENKDSPAQHKPGARFLLETDFSKLGKFQFDGFSIAKERRFDLIVRTSRNLPDDFCAQMVKLFKTSLLSVDYSGNIKINLKENFIKITENEKSDTLIKDGFYI